MIQRNLLFLMLFISHSYIILGQMVWHSDKPYYVSGEIIWYKAYFNLTISDGSSINIKVVNDEQDIIHSSFVKVKDKSINGYYRIPYDIPAGNYIFVVESKDRAAKNVRIGEITIPIYNDLIQNNIALNDSLPPFSGKNMPDEINVNIDVISPSVNSGQTISARITLTDKAGRPVKGICSAAVTDKGLIDSNEEIPVVFQQAGLAYNDLTNELYYEGRVYDGKGSPLQANVIGAYSSEDDSFSFTKSDSDGTFVLPREEFTGEKELQFIGYQFEHPEIMVRMNTAATVNSVKSPLHFTPSVINYLESSRKRKKINQYFKIRERVKFIDDDDKDSPAFSAQATYNVEEYQNFGSLSEFSRNMMMPLRFSGNGSERTAQVINPKAQKKANYYLNGDPLFIIDGKLTRNAEYAGNLEQTEVRELGIIYENKVLRSRYNVMGSAGVVIINTLGKREQLPESDERNIKRVNGLQSRVDYPVRISVADEVNDLPVFEPQLYWNPEISTNDSGEATIDFVQSNDQSSWRIVVVARSVDGSVGVGFFDYTTNFAEE